MQAVLAVSLYHTAFWWILPPKSVCDAVQNVWPRPTTQYGRGFVFIRAAVPQRVHSFRFFFTSPPGCPIQVQFDVL